MKLTKWEYIYNSKGESYIINEIVMDWYECIWPDGGLEFIEAWTIESWAEEMKEKEKNYKKSLT